MLAGGFLAGTVAAAADAGKSAGTQAPATGGIVRLDSSGLGWLRDCKPWTPQGLSFFGRLIPAGWTESDASTTRARDQFGDWTFKAVQAMHGDVIRFQVGMPFIDPESASYSPAYLQDIRTAVMQARATGLSVILSLQYEHRVGVNSGEANPKDHARRAWHTLGPMFQNDLGVVYELFNEPASPPVPPPHAWEVWRAGHQAIIDDLRSAGIRNTLLVDGLNGSHTFEGAPALHDPLNQTGYAIHPYLRADYTDPGIWDTRFGTFAKSHALMVSEWGVARKHCEEAGIPTAQALFHYLQAHHIGIIGYGSDEHNNTMLNADDGRFTPSTFEGKSCSQPGVGPGELIQKYALDTHGEYSRARTDASCPAH